MSALSLPTTGFDLQPRLSTAQIPIAVGASGSLSSVSGLATITTTAAHGLTMQPAAGVMPNYFVSFGGTAPVTAGVGVLVGNIFRILSIPSPTTFTIYTTVTAATMTAATVIPIFLCPFTAANGSYWAGGPTQVVGGIPLPIPTPNLAGGFVVMQNGPNARLRVNVDSTALILDASVSSVSPTPAVAPTWADAQSYSTNGSCFAPPPTFALWADGAAGTTYVNVK